MRFEIHTSTSKHVAICVMVQGASYWGSLEMAMDYVGLNIFGTFGFFSLLGDLNVPFKTNQKVRQTSHFRVELSELRPFSFWRGVWKHYASVDRT